MHVPRPPHPLTRSGAHRAIAVYDHMSRLRLANPIGRTDKSLDYSDKGRGRRQTTHVRQSRTIQPSQRPSTVE